MILAHLQVKQTNLSDGGCAYSIQTTLMPDEGACFLEDMSDTYIAFKRGMSHQELAQGFRKMADWLEKL